MEMIAIYNVHAQTQCFVSGLGLSQGYIRFQPKKKHIPLHFSDLDRELWLLLKLLDGGCHDVWKVNDVLPLRIVGIKSLAVAGGVYD
jgi:hypothetical protein